jgi:hypothetical protein
MKEIKIDVVIETANSARSINDLKKSIKELDDTAVENTVELRPSQPFQVGEKSVITLEATTNVNNTIASVRFSGVQIKNR